MGFGGVALLSTHLLKQREIEALHQVRVLDVAAEVLALGDRDAVLLLRQVLALAELCKRLPQNIPTKYSRFTRYILQSNGLLCEF